MFSLTKKILDAVYRWHQIASGKKVLLSLAVTIGFFLSIAMSGIKYLNFHGPMIPLFILAAVAFWGTNFAISESKYKEDKMDKVFLPFWLTFLPLMPFAFITDIVKLSGQSIYNMVRGIGTWLHRKIVTRKMESDSLSLIRNGHSPQRIEPLTLRGGPKQVITPALVTKGAIEFITDQIGRKKMIDGPDGEEGIIIPEYRISENGERATAMVTYRLIKDSQVHANVKKDEVHFRYFVLAFTIDRVKGTLATGVLEEGTESPSAKVLDGAAESLWGEQIQRDLDKFKSFDAKLHEFRTERQISPATSPVQQTEG